jgi:hypothetical protein
MELTQDLNLETKPKYKSVTVDIKDAHVNISSVEPNGTVTDRMHRYDSGCCLKILFKSFMCMHSLLMLLLKTQMSDCSNLKCYDLFLIENDFSLLKIVPSTSDESSRTCKLFRPFVYFSLN